MSYFVRLKNQSIICMIDNIYNRHSTKTFAICVWYFSSITTYIFLHKRQIIYSITKIYQTSEKSCVLHQLII